MSISLHSKPMVLFIYKSVKKNFGLLVTDKHVFALHLIWNIPFPQQKAWTLNKSDFPTKYNNIPKRHVYHSPLLHPPTQTFQHFWLEGVPLVVVMAVVVVVIIQLHLTLNGSLYSTRFYPAELYPSDKIMA